MTGLARLQDVLIGEVIEPGMPGYEAVRRPARLADLAAHRCGGRGRRVAAMGIRRAGRAGRQPQNCRRPRRRASAGHPVRGDARAGSRHRHAARAQPVISKSEFFRRPLPARSVTELLHIFSQDRPSGQYRELNFTPMGGAYNRVPAEATAFVHRSERFLLEHAAAGADTARWVQRSWATVHPWGSGRVYPNFPDPDLTNWAEAYHGGNHARLAAVKRAYDPQRLHQSI